MVWLRWIFRLLPFGLELLRIISDFKYKREEKKMAKLGIQNTQKVIDLLGGVVKTAYNAGRNGYGIEDVAVLPSLVIDVVGIIQRSKDVADEIKDLDITEIKDIIVSIIEEIQEFTENDTDD